MSKVYSGSNIDGSSFTVHKADDGYSVFVETPQAGRIEEHGLATVEDYHSALERLGVVGVPARFRNRHAVNMSRAVRPETICPDLKKDRDIKITSIREGKAK